MNIFNLYAYAYDPFMKIMGLYRTETIIKYLEPTKEQAVLDIGGGTGFIASKIKPRVKKVVLIDDSNKMLKRAKRYEGLELCQVKSHQIPYPDNYFDSIICTDVLHHIKDIEPTILEMKRVLKVGGKVLISEFDIKGFRGALFWLFERTTLLNYCQFIKPETLLATMKENQFTGKVNKISRIEYIYVGNKK